VGQFESPLLMRGHPELAKDLAPSACGLTTIVTVRARSFRAEVPQDDADAGGSNWPTTHVPHGTLWKSAVNITSCSG
jgi:hypothetical protein